MQYIRDLLNKIKWDKNKKPEDYSIAYFDRVLNKKNEIRFLDIKRIEGNFMVVENLGQESHIPLHRIRQVKNKGIIVWQR